MKANVRWGDKMVKDKEALLLCAENAAKYLNEKDCGNFVAFILDIIDFVKKQNEDEHQKIQQLCEILYNVENSNIEILGGGKSIKIAYTQFIDEFLNITKTKNGYEIGRHDYKKLTMDELHYVFAWVRRLVKEQSTQMKQSDRKHDKSDIKHEKGKGKYQDYRNHNEAKGQKHKSKKTKQAGKKAYETVSDGPLNTQLADQLESLLEKMNNEYKK